MKKKLFLLGIGSLTGQKIAQKIKNSYELYGSFNLRNPDLDCTKSFNLDVTNYDDLKKILLSNRPDYIVNLCALNNVDFCESHPTEAKQINGTLVENLSNISESIGSKLIHLSTDSVFDGNKESPYLETDSPNPINIYGKTKLLGEKFALKNSNNLVIRASVLYGWFSRNLQQQNSSSLKPLNFGLWLISKLVSNEQVNVIVDELSSPIIADDFASSIIHLVEEDQSGIFHSAPNICINRYDFSKKLSDKLNLDTNLIKPTSIEKLGRKVPTGKNKCLDSTKIQETTKFEFMTLNESLSLLQKQFSTN